MPIVRPTVAILLSVGICLCSAAPAAPQQPTPRRKPDVVYVPTPPEVVTAMLDIANVTKDDVVYDLGCGDGRIVIAAAAKRGARGVGIDIDPARIKEATENAKAAGVADRVTFLEQDLFESDIREATVVMLYLLPELNLRLRPKLWKELKPGTRIVSHIFDMDDWNSEKMVEIDGHQVYFWVVPENAAEKASQQKE
jgi:ribosomal protein L11 methylase PrmA